MFLFLLAALTLAIAGAVALVQRRWRRGLYTLGSAAVLSGAIVYYLVSWNAVMLKVQHYSATRATR